LKRSALTLLLILSSAAFLGAQTAQLKEITPRRDGAKLVVDILVDGAFTPEVLTVNFPRRLVIDLTPVERIAVAPYTPIDELGVLAVRTGQFKETTARVVFDIGDRTPSHGVGLIPGGLRVTFWYEGGEEPLPEKRPEEKAEPTPPVKAEEPRGPRRTNFFLGARGGFLFLLNSQVESPSAFSLYGETGTLLETHDLSSGPVIDVFAGKYFNRLKVGAGVTIWNLKQDPTFALSLPHPYLANSNRDVTFTTDRLSNGMLDLYAFLQYAFYDSEKFNVWAGVIAGLTKGAFQNLDDYDYSEKAPYGASDVEISNVTTLEETYSTLLFGGLLTFEYRLASRVAVVFDVKMLYANPKLLNLGLRANFLRIQPVLGLQINF